MGTDFGEGTLTDSGYPRIATAWKRGTPLAEATTLFEGREGGDAVTDVMVDAGDADGEVSDITDDDGDHIAKAW